MTDPYKVLGVSPNASDEEVKAAYQIGIAANRQHGQPVLSKDLGARRRKVMLGHQPRLSAR